jgi:hypothetical protein
VRDEGNRSGKQQKALNHIAEAGKAKGVRQDKGSQDQNRKTGYDACGPELAIGAQRDSPRCHSRLGLEKAPVTEVIRENLESGNLVMERARARLPLQNHPIGSILTITLGKRVQQKVLLALDLSYQ